MVSGISRITCLISCLALVSCASNDLMVKRQSEAEAKIERLNQVEKVNMLRMNELSGQVQALDDQSKNSAVMLKQLQSAVQELRLSQDELKSLITASAATPAAQLVQKIEVVNQEPAPKGKESGPPADYLKAFGFYSANNFPAAIDGFEAFLKRNPKSEFAANASYWIGECYYSQSDLARARASFQRTVDNYPKSSKMPDAMLKLGYTLAAMKEKDKAQSVFESLIKSYPGSPAAIKARERLTVN